MSDRRKLPPIDPDAPPTEEEVSASKRLRDALEDPSSAHASPELDLVKSLQAAWAPDPLDEADHAALLHETLVHGSRGSAEGGPRDDVPASEGELRLAAELRDELEKRPNELVVALRSAWSPTEIDEAEHRRLVDAAIGKGQDAKVVVLKPRARPIRVAMATTTTLIALAASIVLWITTSATRAEAPLAKARSTQPLFDEPFKPGETSARIDRIAIARASDYRDNRFAKWGVR